MASFLPLDTPKALGTLNGHLGAHSYITGYVPSSDDVVVFNAFTAAPDAKMQHIVRWYKHIASFGAASASWPAPEAPKTAVEQDSPAGASAAPAAAEEDDDMDLFGEETEEEKAAKEARTKALESQKKAAPVGRSAVILDCKPWEEDTDLKEMERLIREIAHEGLEWKASKLVPIAFKINALQIMCHVVDDIVSVDEDVIAKIMELEDYVQSVDIFAFNKL